jgi:hypothetical protein
MLSRPSTSIINQCGYEAIDEELILEEAQIAFHFQWHPAHQYIVERNIMHFICQ